MTSRKKLSIHDYNARLPDNLSFKYLNVSREKSPLKCSLCGYEDPNWTIFARNASKYTKCPKCQNSGLNKIDRLNQRLTTHNFKYIEYTNSHEKAKVQCLTCSLVWEIIPKNITSRTKCRDCKNAIDEEKF